VTTSVLELIEEHGLLSGDRLPATAELADIFEVAPTTMREVLARLEATNIISVRHGLGTYVSENSGRLIISNPHVVRVDSEMVLGLIRTRELLEPDLAAAAARRAGVIDFDELSRTVATGLAQSQPAHASDPNIDFHRQLALISGERVMGWTLTALLDAYAPVQAEICSSVDPHADAREHNEILDAVKRGDPEGARRHMETHLGEIRRGLETAMRSPRPKRAGSRSRGEKTSSRRD
jgi:GntR family transcriptional repressor for pyruvate dehydrogenase complex